MSDVPERKCLVVDPVQDTGKCKQLGGDGCRWNLDAIVDCFYVRGDDVDVTKWEVGAEG